MKGDKLGHDVFGLFDWLNGADELITRDGLYTTCPGTFS